MRNNIYKYSDISQLIFHVILKHINQCKMTTRRPIRSVLKEANQAEILRAHQRDDEFVTGLKEKLLDLLQRFGGYRSLLPYVQTGIPFKLLYFIFTSAFGNQTLGEEYTGIVQADLDARKVPSLPVCTLIIIFSILSIF